MHRSQGYAGFRFVFLLVAVMSVALALPAFAFAADGHIKGKVVDDEYKEPMEGITVVGYLYDAANPDFMNWAGEAMVGADGTYDLVVPPGQIIVEFAAYWPSRYLSEFYNDTRDYAASTKVTLGSGATVTGINASLARGATISGTVTDQSTGEPLEGIRVAANFDEGNSIEAFTRTDGTYDIVGLPTGSYIVSFDDIGRTDPSDKKVYVSEWYDSTTLSGATSISLTAPAVRTGVNASMVRGASISGTVTEAGSGDIIYSEDTVGSNGPPIRAIGVQVTDSAGNEVASQWYTEPDGSYFIGGLTAGTYKVKFFDWGSATMELGEGAFYTTQWYSNKASVGAANTITLGATTQQTGVNAAMAPRTTFGTISGSAYDNIDTSRKIPGALVQLYYWDGAYWNQSWDVPATRTDANGDYYFDWVPAGTYRVLVSGWDDGSTIWNELYGYQYLYFGGTQDLLTATSVVVSGGGSVTGRNVYLPRADGYVIIGGSLVNASTGGSVGAGVPVSIYSYNAVEGAMQVVTALTDASGAWRWPVPAGEYKLAFNEMWSYPFAPSGDYVASWYNNAANEPAATIVTATSPGPSYFNDELAQAHHIIGTVDGPSGALQGATVSIKQWDGMYWNEVTSARTDFSGAYDAGGLPSGTYRISFSPPWPNKERLATEYYNNKVSLDWDAQDFTLSGAATDWIADAVLAPGAEFKGRIKLDDSAANVGQDIKVHVWYNVSSYGWKQVQSTYAYAYSEGQWWQSPVPTGQYKFQFDDPYAGLYYPMHYLNKASWADMTLLTPAGGSLTTVLQTMDGLPPVTSSDAVGGYKGDATIHFTATDAVCGVKNTYLSVDGSDFAPGTSLTVSGEGWHTVQYYSEDNLGQAEAVRSIDFEILPLDSFEAVPVSGATRIDTAIAAAESAFPEGAGTVVVATAYNWPDALGGAALAGALDGPILLTSPSDLPATVASAITGLGAGKAVILGGTAAVGTPVETELKALLGAGNVSRVAGSDRYRTAEAIAAETVKLLGAGYDGMALVSTGGNFPDALAASPLAAAKSWPIFLVDKTKPLSATTLAQMQGDGVTDVAILGGTAVVPSGIEDSLKAAFGTMRVDRLAGADRYETGCIVADYGVENAGLFWNRVALATGQNFPDALAGGVLQGRDGSVMLLTPSASLDPFVSAKLTAKKSQITEVKYLGGLNAVSQTVRDAVANIIQ